MAGSQSSPCWKPRRTGAVNVGARAADAGRLATSAKTSVKRTRRTQERIRAILAGSSSRFNSELDLDRLELVLELGQLLAARHQADELLSVDLGLLERAEALAAIEDHEAVAHRIRVVRVVRDEDDGDATLACLQDVPEDDAGLLHAECRRRLCPDQ